MFLAAGLVAVAAGGFLAGRISSVPEEKKAVAGDAKADHFKASSRSSADGGAGQATSHGKREGARESGKPAGKLSDKLIRREEIMRGENPLERNRALLALIDQLGPNEFADVVEQFRALGITQSRLGEYSLLLSAWAKADPTSALEFAKLNTKNSFASTTILASWATTDPEAAIRWAQANFTGDGANPYMIGIIRGIAETDPARATQLMADMPWSEQRGEALQQMMPHILQQGPEAARNWVMGLTDEKLRNGAMTRMAESLADIDPKGTADWLLKNPGEALQRRLDDVYQAWAGKDLAAAQASYQSLPAGQERSNALRGLVTNMAQADPAAALNLINSHPADKTDRVVQEFVWTAFDKAPETAASTIAQMADEGQRNQTYRRFFDRWIETNVAQAEAYAGSIQLPPDIAKHVQARLERARKQ